MCRPTHYTIAYEINPWMSLRRQVRHERAQRQWQRLYDVLTTTLHLTVRLLPPRAGLPDLVFTANAGLVAGRAFIRSTFRYPQRRGEERVAERWARRAGFRVVTLPAPYTFEGEGDALWMGRTLVFGFRFRSDATAHVPLSRRLGARVLPLELADRRFYHLDTCLCPLDATSALWFPNAFDRYGQTVLRRVIKDPIAVSEADAKRFVCNAVVVPNAQSGERAIVLQEGYSAALGRALRARGFTLYPVDLSEFLKAGGSAKCLTLWLRRPSSRAAPGTSH